MVIQFLSRERQLTLWLLRACYAIDSKHDNERYRRFRRIHTYMLTCLSNSNERISIYMGYPLS